MVFASAPNDTGKGTRTSPARVPKGCTVKYKSSMSFATPVAVSVAAFMIAYTEGKWPDRQWIIKPRNPEGITRILKFISVDTDVYDWVSPTWYLARVSEDKIMGDIKQSLGCRYCEAARQ
jgi:hypothetical protein